jgi:ATP-dependent HslUV protease, peptidase subunit HslV
MQIARLLPPAAFPHSPILRSAPLPVLSLTPVSAGVYTPLMAPDVVFHGTTILLVRRGAETAMGGDGQVTLGDAVIKGHAKKIRHLYNDRILVGFAGATADSFALFSRLEAKLEQFHGNLNRAAVDLAQEWRTDRALRHLEAFLLATDGHSTYLLSGTGDVIEPDDGVMAIGSGGSYALAAARALLRNTQLAAREIALEALKVASEICIYTNGEIIIEELKPVKGGRRPR